MSRGGYQHQKRGAPDDFWTPEYAVEPLLPYIPMSARIWEPACGQGHIVNFFQNRGRECFGTDLVQGVDFLADTAAKKIMIQTTDVIVTNPPFSLKDEFLRECYKIGKPFALIMPCTGLEGIDRQAYYKMYGLQVLVPDKRIDFILPSGKPSSAWFPSWWFTFGLCLPSQITFCRLNKPQAQRAAISAQEKQERRDRLAREIAFYSMDLEDFVPGRKGR